MFENYVWNRVWFVNCPKLRDRRFFPTLSFSPGLASSTFGREDEVRSLLYIQRSHLGFDLGGWVRVLAFILLFVVNKLEMPLISWTNCQRLSKTWVPQVHLHFTDPGAWTHSFAASVWLKLTVCVAVSCKENNSFVFLLFLKNHGWATTLPLFLSFCHNNLSKLSLCQVTITVLHHCELKGQCQVAFSPQTPNSSLKH